MDTAPTPSLIGIPLSAIRPSQTKIQQLRRGHFNPTKLIELADSIKTQGLLQPILVRPLAKIVDNVKYEIVAGERRYLAADRAGLAIVDCHVRNLTDDQVLEAQLVENLQREDVHPLEEAEGYRELMTLKHFDAEALGVRVGKSRAYVYARLKLLELCPAGRDALDGGRIDASKALLIARFKGDKLQRQALLRLLNSPHYSYQYAVQTLRDHFMVDLTRAPFDRADATFTRASTKAERHGGGAPDQLPLPACITCPSYSRNDAELQASFAADAHICTEKACYDIKVVAFHARQRDAAQQAGRTVLTGDAAKAAIPDHYAGISATHVDLDAECNDDDFPEKEPDPESPDYEAWERRMDEWQPRTFRALLDDALAKRSEVVVLAEGGKGKLHELLPVKEAAKLLKTKGIDLHVPNPQRAIAEVDTEAMKRQREQQEERQEQESLLRRRVFAEIHKKWKGPLKRDDLAQLANRLLVYGAKEVLGDLYPKQPDLDKMSEGELSRLLALLSVYSCVEHYNRPGALFDLAKRLKIDPTKIKKAIAAEAKAKGKDATKPATKKSAH